MRVTKIKTVLKLCSAIFTYLQRSRKFSLQLPVSIGYSATELFYHKGNCNNIPICHRLMFVSMPVQCTHKSNKPHICGKQKLIPCTLKRNYSRFMPIEYEHINFLLSHANANTLQSPHISTTVCNIPFPFPIILHKMSQRFHFVTLFSFSLCSTLMLREYNM